MFSRIVGRSRAVRLFQVPKTQTRNLSLQEFRSAQILKNYGIKVPAGEAATTPQQAEDIAKKLGNEIMVIKAQALTGGRGQGHFDNGLKGGVKLISSPAEAKMYAEQMLNHKIFTKQTGPKGKPVSAVYIVEREFVRQEAYVAILMDRATQKPIIVVSPQGGMDIESVAVESPEAIHTFPIDIRTGVTDSQAYEVAKALGFSSKAIQEAANDIQKLYKVFIDKDATQIEINPLSETTDHRVVAMDAKLSFDEHASFRQKEIWSWRDLTQEDPYEIEAAKQGLNFIKLDGNIACLVNGAGLAMATLDVIKLYGGEPANFLDSGGGTTADVTKKALELITSQPGVTAIFVNVFGGIVQCDEIAKGLVAGVQNMNLTLPIVARLQGTNQTEAQKLISDSGLGIYTFDNLDEAAQKVCQLS